MSTFDGSVYMTTFYETINKKLETTFSLLLSLNQARKLEKWKVTRCPPIYSPFFSLSINQLSFNSFGFDIKMTKIRLSCNKGLGDVWSLH